MSKIVFLSHSSTDKKFVQAVYDKLRETPYKPWMAPQDITPGMSYGGAIIEGIEVCPVFVVFISLSSVKSEDVRNEIEEAHQSEKYILPVFIENLTLDKELKYYLARKQWINVGKNVEQVFSLLLSTLESVIGTVDGLNESKLEDLKLELSVPSNQEISSNIGDFPKGTRKSRVSMVEIGRELEQLTPEKKQMAYRICDTCVDSGLSYSNEIMLDIIQMLNKH